LIEQNCNLTFTLPSLLVVYFYSLVFGDIFERKMVLTATVFLQLFSIQSSR